MRSQIIVCIGQQHIFELLRGFTRKEQILVCFFYRAGCCIKRTLRNHKRAVVIVIVAAQRHGVLAISCNRQPQNAIFALGCSFRCYCCTVDRHSFATHSKGCSACSCRIAIINHGNAKQLFEHIGGYKGIVTDSLYLVLNIHFGIAIIQSAAVRLQGRFILQKGERLFIAEHRTFRRRIAIQIARFRAIVDAHIVDANSTVRAPSISQHAPNKRILQVGTQPHVLEFCKRFAI